jgi:hypothetical protein
MDQVKGELRQRIESLLDSWEIVAKTDPVGAGLTYQKYEEGRSQRALLYMPFDPELADKDRHERRFVANRSMRDVEHAVDVYVTTLKSGEQARQEEEA